MARRVRDINLESRAARAKLKASGKPYFKQLSPGLHVGYRKGKRGAVWVVRRYAGGGDVYIVKTIARADDIEDADGKSVLTFWQAQEKAWAASKTERPVGPYTVAEAITDYLALLEGRSSYNDAKKGLEAHALPVFGQHRVDELTAEMLRKWHKKVATAPRRVRTKRGGIQRMRAVDLKDPDIARARKVSANNLLGQLKAALNHAFTEGKVASDLEWRRVKPFPKVKRSRATYLTLDQCKRLLNACDPEFRPLVRAAMETGARYGELCRLRCRDFHRDSGTIYFELTKAGGSRHVVLTADGVEFFAELVAGRPGPAPMFGREWRASQQARPLLEACKRASIDPPIGIHALRHTWASLAVMAGIPMPVVARNLGHADCRMVEKHYQHLAPSYVADTIRAHAPKFGKTKSNVRSI